MKTPFWRALSSYLPENKLPWPSITRTAAQREGGFAKAILCLTRLRPDISSVTSLGFIWLVVFAFNSLSIHSYPPLSHTQNPVAYERERSLERKLKRTCRAGSVTSVKLENFKNPDLNFL